MAKKKHKFKNFFNFKFRDSNADFTVRNYKVFDASIKAFFIYLLLILPLFAYSYIIFANSNLSFYIKYETTDGLKIWNYIPIGNGRLITAFWGVGMAFLIITLITFFLFKPIITGKHFPKNRLYVYIIFLGVFAILTILFFGLSQFEYSRFYAYYRYSLMFENYADIKTEWAKPVTEYFMEHYNQTTYDYGWASSSISLWMIFFQMMFAFAAFLILQNAVFTQYNAKDLSDENYILLKNPNNGNDNGLVINNRFLRGIRNFFRNDQRNLTVYIITGSALVLISNLVYSILISSSGTNMASLITWNYRTSSLLRDLNGFVNDQGVDAAQEIFKTSGQYFGSLFTVGFLPIISLGLTISMLFFFIALFIREKRVSYKVFVAQTITLFVLLIVTVSTMLASKILVYNLADVWSTGQNNTDFLQRVNEVVGNQQANIDALFEYFPPNRIFSTAGFKIEWLSPSSNIADAILSYSFIIGLFSLVTINNNHLKTLAKKFVSELKRKNAKQKVKKG